MKMQQQTRPSEIVVKDEEVIEALLRDAKRFKSKWELNSNETKRSKPNTTFLKRTLSAVVRINNRKCMKERDKCGHFDDHYKEKSKNVENRGDFNVLKYKIKSHNIYNKHQNDQCLNKTVSNSHKSKYKLHDTNRMPTKGAKN